MSGVLYIYKFLKQPYKSELYYTYSYEEEMRFREVK